MLTPLVIPGVILGISILAFASRVADLWSELFGGEADFLRPGLPLVVLGPSHAAVLWTITLPILRPALIGSAAIAFLMSFENFNTTLMLVGTDSPLTIMMYGRMREGASPVLNAVSLFLMVASAAIAVTLIRRRRSPGS